MNRRVKETFGDGHIRHLANGAVSKIVGPIKTGVYDPKNGPVENVSLDFICWVVQHVHTGDCCFLSENEIRSYYAPVKYDFGTKAYKYTGLWPETLSNGEWKNRRVR